MLFRSLVKTQEQPAEVINIEDLREQRERTTGNELMGGGKGIPFPELNTCTSCGEKTPFENTCLDCQQEGK